MVIILVLAVLLIGSALFFTFNNNGQQTQQEQPSLVKPVSNVPVATPEETPKKSDEVINPITGMLTHVYTSKEFGIQFTSPQEGLILQKTEKGDIEAYVPADPKGGCEKPNCIVLHNVTYDRLSGAIHMFDKPATQTFTEAIEGMITGEGKDSSACKVNTEEANPDAVTVAQTGQVSANVTLLKEYIPTDKEIFTELKKTNLDLNSESFKKMCSETPECGWAKDDLIETKTKALCSRYSQCYGYQCGSYFLYEPTATQEKFMYLYGLAQTPTYFDWGSITFLK